MILKMIPLIIFLFPKIEKYFFSFSKNQEIKINKLTFFYFCFLSNNRFMTIILPDYPGYLWRHLPDGIALDWQPIPAIYSPPILHVDLVQTFVPIHVPVPLGILIGHQGCHFKEITRRTGCQYIFCRNDVIEIWGNQEAVNIGIQQMLRHILLSYLEWKTSTRVELDHTQF
jgi:hypothetical protein